MTAILQTLDQLVSGGLLIYLVYNGFKKFLLIGDVTTYNSCISTVKGNVMTIFMNLGSAVKSSLGINLFFKFLKLETSDKINEEIIEIEDIQEIELVHVSYKYAGSSIYALQDIRHCKDYARWIFPRFLTST